MNDITAKALGLWGIFLVIISPAFLIFIGTQGVKTEGQFISLMLQYFPYYLAAILGALIIFISISYIIRGIFHINKKQ